MLYTLPEFVKNNYHAEAILYNIVSSDCYVYFSNREKLLIRFKNLYTSEKFMELIDNEKELSNFVIFSKNKLTCLAIDKNFLKNNVEIKLELPSYIRILFQDFSEAVYAGDIYTDIYEQIHSKVAKELTELANHHTYSYYDKQDISKLFNIINSLGAFSPKDQILIATNCPELLDNNN